MTTDSEAALAIGESGRPVAYERGLQAFMGHELFVGPGALRAALPLLRDDGILLFEFGVGQDRQVKLLFERSGAYEAIQLFSNEQGQPRVITGRKRSHG